MKKKKAEDSEEEELLVLAPKGVLIADLFSEEQTERIMNLLELQARRMCKHGGLGAIVFDEHGGSFREVFFKEKRAGILRRLLKKI